MNWRTVVLGIGTHSVRGPDMQQYGTQQYYPSGATSESVRLGWRRPDGMAGLGLVNFLLRIVTLGIHQFWGKAEVRRRLWSGIRINDEPLTYTGTGWELFRGFLLALALVFLPLTLGVVGIQLAFGQNPAVMGALFTALYIPFFLLVFVGFYSANRYRLSRTEWRGIRGSLDGSAWSYAWHCLWTAILVPLTLGWIWPWRATFLQRKLVDNMRFGNRPFSFDAPAGPLYWRFAALWVVGIVLAALFGGGFAYVIKAMVESGGFPQPGGPDRVPTPQEMQKIAILSYQIAALYIGFFLLMGLAGSWYRAFTFNHFARHTHFEGATFDAKVTGLGLVWQALSNAIIVIATLGILTPVAMARALGYRISRTSLTGAVPVDQIVQSGSEQSTAGEGLAQMFDIDVF